MHSIPPINPEAEDVSESVVRIPDRGDHDFLDHPIGPKKFGPAAQHPPDALPDEENEGAVSGDARGDY
jgi:hypothetical protein